ncbi:MAG TPA: hypothetical protein VMF86_11295 [Stellaceae bacterium]|nr:hypothetical protein [Stellaceae bacterium]
MDDNQCGDDDLVLRSGEIWLIEYGPAGLSAPERAALISADVVLYDHALAAVMADLLPPGRYAEPLATTAEDGAAAISPRALQLAGAGWRTVHVVEACPERRRRLRDAAGRLALPSGTGRPGVRNLDDIAPEGQPLTLVIGPLAAAAAPAAYAFTGNGLAG